MIQLDISWAGRDASDYSRAFKTAAAVRSFQPALTTIAKDVVAPSISKNFEAQGRPRWTPLAQATVERKAKSGAADPSRILVHSGAMMNTAIDPSNYIVTSDELRAAPFGISYWGYHQTGEGVPQRVIMMLQAADRSKITRIFADFIRTIMVFDPRSPEARPFTGGGLL